MPTISKDVWITREGQQLEVKDMASSHLLSTIHFIERNRFTSAVDTAMRVRDLNEKTLYDNPVEYYLQWPIQYEALVAEAQRRGLIYRGVKGLVKKLEK